MCLALHSRAAIIFAVVIFGCTGWSVPGATAKSHGEKRCGVEFYDDGIGRHDGSVNGKRYVVAMQEALELLV